VYATGLSNGAFMSSRVGCVLNGRIAAIAPVAGTYFPPEGCSKPMPILSFQGTADRTVPFEAGRVLGIMPYAGVRSAMAGWAANNKCPATFGTERISPHVTKESYGGCSADTALVVVEDGAHVWPGSLIGRNRPGQTQEISAAELIWQFFAAHRLG
jgi:polyhydroxybutyrate depolymerase